MKNHIEYDFLDQLNTKSRVKSKIMWFYLFSIKHWVTMSLFWIFILGLKLNRFNTGKKLVYIWYSVLSRYEIWKKKHYFLRFSAKSKIKHLSILFERFDLESYNFGLRSSLHLRHVCKFRAKLADVIIKCFSVRVKLLSCKNFQILLNNTKFEVNKIFRIKFAKKILYSMKNI